MILCILFFWISCKVISQFFFKYFFLCKLCYHQHIIQNNYTEAYFSAWFILLESKSIQPDYFFISKICHRIFPFKFLFKAVVRGVSRNVLVWGWSLNFFRKGSHSGFGKKSFLTTSAEILIKFRNIFLNIFFLIIRKIEIKLERLARSIFKGVSGQKSSPFDGKFNSTSSKEIFLFKQKKMNHLHFWLYSCPWLLHSSQFLLWKLI